jgi:hypothetical protein
MIPIIPFHIWFDINENWVWRIPQSIPRVIARNP